MSNIVLAYNNLADRANLSGGLWTTSLPQVNLQNRLITKVARTQNAAATSSIINVDLVNNYHVGAVALIAHNLSVDATVRVRTDDVNDFATPIYDSGTVSAWAGGVIDPDLLEWENDNFWLGTITAVDRAGFQVPFIDINLARPMARYLRIEITDTSNGDGYIQIGRLFIADVWTPTYNYSYGAAVGFEDPTPIATSLGGQEFFDPVARFRVYRLSLGWMTESEAYEQALDMQRLVGSSGEVLIVPDQADTTNGIRRNLVGRLRSLSPVVHSNFGIYSMEMEIKELL